MMPTQPGELNVRPAAPCFGRGANHTGGMQAAYAGTRPTFPTSPDGAAKNPEWPPWERLSLQPPVFSRPGRQADTEGPLTARDVLEGCAHAVPLPRRLPAKAWRSSHNGVRAVGVKVADKGCMRPIAIRLKPWAACVDRQQGPQARLAAAVSGSPRSGKSPQKETTAGGNRRSLRGRMFRWLEGSVQRRRFSGGDPCRSRWGAGRVRKFLF